MTCLEDLIEVLEASVKKNGDLPLTTKYLLNLCKCADRLATRKGEIHHDDIPF